jgi:hypothetical protein
MPDPTICPEYVIADAIAANIRAATFTGPITSLSATVDESPDHENLDNPGDYAATVNVIPAPELDVSFAETRGGDLHEMDIVVVITKRLASLAERRVMAELRWQMQEAFRSGALLANVPTWWDLREMNVAQTFDPDGLRGPNVYRAGLRLRFSALLSR